MCETTTILADVKKALEENNCQYFFSRQSVHRTFIAVTFNLEYKTSTEVKNELISRGLKCKYVEVIIEMFDGYADAIYIVSFENGSINLNSLKRYHGCLFRTIIK